MTTPNYAVFHFEEHQAQGGWADFKATFETMGQATEAGQAHCNRGDVVQIVSLAERRILIVGEWSYVPSTLTTLTGSPVHSFFQWRAYQP